MISEVWIESGRYFTCIMKVGPQAQAGNLGQSHNGPLTGKNANILYWWRLLRSVESLQHNNRILDIQSKFTILKFNLMTSIVTIFPTILNSFVWKILSWWVFHAIQTFFRRRKYFCRVNWWWQMGKMQGRVTETRDGRHRVCVFSCFALPDPDTGWTIVWQRGLIRWKMTYFRLKIDHAGSIHCLTARAGNEPLVRLKFYYHGEGIFLVKAPSSTLLNRHCVPIWSLSRRRP